MKCNQRKENLPRLFLFMIIFFQLVGCGKTDEEKSQMNLDTGMVKILIEGNKFNIPLRYMYGEAIEKRGKWPTPKKVRAKVGAINLSVILPELKPYYREDEHLWKLPGHGVQLRVSLMKPVGSKIWYAGLLNRMNKRVQDGVRVKKKNIYELHHFSGPRSDRFFPLEDLKLAITCDKSEFVEYPSCMVKSNYDEGLVLEYYYSKDALHEWKKIDLGIKKMFDKFRVVENK